ncbi:ABC transporter ATP-binding protein [Citricoccus sp. GCM10030269]|uniref:ABC transporter ATP-binding protein n=1 Tax=Citricoccus sp. GCM10030269 TaxID=3273388 RepID=UPI00361E3DD1
MTHKLVAENVGHTFQVKGESVVAMQNMSFHAREQEFVTFVGPSGSGKSTLFNVLAGLLTPSRGDVFVNGEAITGTPHPALGYVLQKDLLLPWRTLIDNVVLGLEVRGVPKREAYERARPLFARYRLEGFEDQYPHSLSGGMRQRAALMRTLVLDPEVVLMDEAYKALDYPLKIELESDLLATVKSLHKTVVFVTHDIEEAVTLSDRVYVLKARPGEIVKEITVDLGIDSTDVAERRTSPRFNDYYEQIWRSIADGNYSRSNGKSGVAA